MKIFQISLFIFFSFASFVFFDWMTLLNNFHYNNIPLAFSLFINDKIPTSLFNTLGWYLAFISMALPLNKKIDFFCPYISNITIFLMISLIAGLYFLKIPLVITNNSLSQILIMFNDMTGQNIFSPQLYYSIRGGWLYIISYFIVAYLLRQSYIGYYKLENHYYVKNVLSGKDDKLTHIVKNDSGTWEFNSEIKEQLKQLSTNSKPLINSTHENKPIKEEKIAIDKDKAVNDDIPPSPDAITLTTNIDKESLSPDNDNEETSSLTDEISEKNKNLWGEKAAICSGEIMQINIMDNDIHLLVDDVGVYILEECDELPASEIILYLKSHLRPSLESYLFEGILDEESDVFDLIDIDYINPASWEHFPLHIAKRDANIDNNVALDGQERVTIRKILQDGLKNDQR